MQPTPWPHAGIVDFIEGQCTHLATSRRAIFCNGRSYHEPAIEHVFKMLLTTWIVILMNRHEASRPIDEPAVLAMSALECFTNGCCGHNISPVVLENPIIQPRLQAHHIATFSEICATIPMPAKAALENYFARSQYKRPDDTEARIVTQVGILVDIMLCAEQRSTLPCAAQSLTVQLEAISKAAAIPAIASLARHIQQELRSRRKSKKCATSLIDVVQGIVPGMQLIVRWANAPMTHQETTLVHTVKQTLIALLAMLLDPRPHTAFTWSDALGLTIIHDTAEPMIGDVVYGIKQDPAIHAELHRLEVEAFSHYIQALPLTARRYCVELFQQQGTATPLAEWFDWSEKIGYLLTPLFELRFTQHPELAAMVEKNIIKLDRLYPRLQATGLGHIYSAIRPEALRHCSSIGQTDLFL